MRTETYLRQINKFDDRIDGAVAQIEMLYGKAMDISIRVKDVDVQSSTSGDIMENAIIKIADLKNGIAKDFDREIELRRTIISQINSIEDDKQQKILSKRYLQRKSWKEIESETGLTYHHIMKIKDAAIKQFESQFGETYLKKAL